MSSVLRAMLRRRHPDLQRILEWAIDCDNYRAIPLMSDGSPAPVLELRPLFERFLEETAHGRRDRSEFRGAGPGSHIYRDVLGRMGSVYALDATTAMAACHEPRLTHNCHTRHTRGRW